MKLLLKIAIIQLIKNTPPFRRGCILDLDLAKECIQDFRVNSVRLCISIFFSMLLAVHLFSQVLTTVVLRILPAVEFQASIPDHFYHLLFKVLDRLLYRYNYLMTRFTNNFLIGDVKSYAWKYPPKSCQVSFRNLPDRKMREKCDYYGYGTLLK